MISIKKRFAAATLAALTTLAAGLSLASPDEEKALQPTTGMLTKEQAIEKALAEHPGEVTKAYREKKKGKEVWEVKIKGDDGKKWEIYYDIKTGELVGCDLCVIQNP